MKKNKAIRKQQEYIKACKRAHSYPPVRYESCGWLHLWSPQVLTVHILERVDAFIAAWVWFAKKRATCSCYLCTIEKRKWRGNSWHGKPIQERREIQRADCDEQEDDSTIYYNPYFGWEVVRVPPGAEMAIQGSVY